MAYTDVAGKTILDAFGKFQAVLYAACVTGDLLSRDVSNEGFILADDSTSVVASAVALENGAAGDTIWMALAAVIEVRPTESSGAWSDGVLALAADVMDTLYLGESGKVEDSAGTCPQVVGFIISTTRAVLAPNTYITGTDQTLSGNLVVGGTAAVTGVSTLTGLLNADGGIAVDTDKFTVSAAGAVTAASTLEVTGASTLTGAVTATAGVTIGSAYGLKIAEKNYASSGAIATAGYVTLSADGADLAMTLAAPTAGSLLIIFDKANSGTKNHVVSAKAASGEFDGSNNNTLTFNATEECVVLFAVTTTLWVIVENIGSVGLSTT